VARCCGSLRGLAPERENSVPLASWSWPIEIQTRLPAQNRRPCLPLHLRNQAPWSPPSSDARPACSNRRRCGGWDLIAQMSASISEEICLSELASDRRCITEIAAPYRIVHVNSSWCVCTGYAQSEVVGRTCKMLQGADTCRHTLQVLHAALKELRPITVRLVNYRKDGVPFVNDLTVVPLRDAATKVATHFLGVIREHLLPGHSIRSAIPTPSALATLGGIGVPEERQATELSRDWNLRPLASPPRIPTQLQEALRSEVAHPQMITERAAPHKIIHVNNAWRRACGYRAEELIGRPYTILHGPQTEPGLQPLLKQAFLAGQQVTCKATYYTKSQQPMQSHVTISPLLDSSGTESHYYVHLLTSPNDQPPLTTQPGLPSNFGSALNSSIGQLGALKGGGYNSLLGNGLAENGHTAIDLLSHAGGSHGDVLPNGAVAASSLCAPNLNAGSPSAASSSSSTSLVDAERSVGGMPAVMAPDVAMSSSLLSARGGLRSQGVQQTDMPMSLSNGLLASATPLVNGLQNGLQNSLLTSLPPQTVAKLVAMDGGAPAAAELPTRMLQQELQGQIPFGMGAASGSIAANSLALNGSALGGAPCASTVPSLASTLANGGPLPAAGPGSLVHAVVNAQVQSMVHRTASDEGLGLTGPGGSSTAASDWEHACIAQALSASSGMPSSVSPSMSLLAKLTGGPSATRTPVVAAYLPSILAQQQLGAQQPLASLLPQLPLAAQATPVPLQGALSGALNVSVHQGMQPLSRQPIQPIPELVARGENGARVPPFLNKLYTIVADVEFNEYASWVRNGTAFCISNPQVFADRCLPRFFKHNKMGSFQQQLLTYGFQRVPNESVLDISSVWQHTYFREGHPELLDKINRQGAKRASMHQEDDLAEDDGSRMQGKLNGLCTSLDELHHELRSARVVEMRAIDALMLKVTKRLRPEGEALPWESAQLQTGRKKSPRSGKNSPDAEDDSRSGDSSESASKSSSRSVGVQRENNATADTGVDSGGETSADSSSGDVHDCDVATFSDPPSAEPTPSAEPVEMAAEPEFDSKGDDDDAETSGAPQGCEETAEGCEETAEGCEETAVGCEETAEGPSG